MSLAAKTPASLPTYRPLIGAGVVLAHGLALLAATWHWSPAPRPKPAVVVIGMLSTPVAAPAAPSPSAPATASPPSRTAPPPMPVAATPSQNALSEAEAPQPEAESTPPSTPAPATANPVAEAPAVLEPPRFGLAYLNNPAPTYPAIARRLRQTGLTQLRVQVNPEGRAQAWEIRDSSGHPALDRAALEAVAQWRFVPARQGDTTVTAWVVVPINWTLNN